VVQLETQESGVWPRINHRRSPSHRQARHKPPCCSVKDQSLADRDFSKREATRGRGYFLSKKGSRTRLGHRFIETIFKKSKKRVYFAKQNV
jgi:hypothetical protein